jgi:hypothetical protein
VSFVHRVIELVGLQVGRHGCGYVSFECPREGGTLFVVLAGR